MMEFELNGHTYRVAKMSTFQQFHVARKLAPVLSGVVATLGTNGGDFAQVVQPLVDAVSGMSDADTEYVLSACMAVVSRQTDPKTWAPIWRDGRLAFDDIELATMLQIAAKVVQDSLGNTFGALPASLPQK